MDQQNSDEQFVYVAHTGADQLNQATALDRFLAKRSIVRTGVKWGNAIFMIQLVAVFIVGSMVDRDIGSVFFAPALVVYFGSLLIGNCLFLGLNGFSSAGMPVTKTSRVKGVRAKVIGTLVLVFAAVLMGLVVTFLWIRVFAIVVE